MKEEIRYEGIDGWNRPVFKSVKYRNRFGSVHKLFSLNATKEEVLREITEEDLCFFGTSFGCEPMGNTVSDIIIVK